MYEHMLQLARQFLDDMRRQKLRTLLTMSGITWGTMSVILLLAFGESLKTKSLENMSGMGNNIVIMYGGMTNLSWNGMPPGRYIRLREDVVPLMRAAIPEIDMISPEIDRWTPIQYGEKRQSYNTTGVNPEYGIIRNIIPEKGGRFINPDDYAERRRVVVLGNQVRDELFGENGNAIGKTVMVNKIPFTVIGVMRKKVQNSSYMNQDRDIVFMPFTTAQVLWGVTTINRVIYTADTATDTPAVKKKTAELLGRRYGFDPEDPGALSSWDTSEMMQFILYFFYAFEAFLFFGGVLTLVVGGIGVANIMYVSVRERRREIGIKTALGATPPVILGQFLLESAIITGIGGFLGVVGAVIIIVIFGSPLFSGLHGILGIPSVNLPIALVTAGVLTLVGFAAGWSPAKSAADMDPVRALEF